MSWKVFFILFYFFSNARNTNLFIKKNYKLLMWWVVIGKWKN